MDSFSTRAPDDFEAALRAHLDDGIERLVVDVREDPGGFVDAAVDISSQFLADGPIFWEESADGSQRSVEVQPGGLATEPSIEVVVLIDDGSASASEILAGHSRTPGERVGRRDDVRQGHGPGVDAAPGRERRVSPLGRKMADPRQGLDPWLRRAS